MRLRLFGQATKKEFAELRENFQALTKPEQDIFLMAQLRSMDGGATNASRRLMNKNRVNKRTIYCWNHNTPICQKTYLNMLGIGRNYFESSIKEWSFITGPR